MQLSFMQLKKAFTSELVLIHFHLAKLIELKAEASGYVIAVIILHQASEVRGAQEGLSNRTKYTAKNNWQSIAF